MEKILHHNELLGVHVKGMHDGSTPLSDEKEPLQLLTLKHSKGTRITPHTHRNIERVTTHLQECLVVIKGALQITLYGAGTEPVKEVLVYAGEAFIFVSGGHSIMFLEDAEVFEIKNGPFKQDRISL